MASPTTSHGGFLIPNAEGIASTKMAEPDQVDFNTLGNSNWGIISGCATTLVGTTATVTAGIALVNGEIVEVAGGTVALGAGGSQPRFDLIGVNTAGTVVVVSGSPNADPVYPDVPVGTTLLAAVFCPAGSSSFSNTVSDKRFFLQSTYVATGTGTDTVLINKNGAIDTFKIDAAGRIEWNDGDTYLYRESAASLRLHSNLGIDGTLQVTGNTTLTGTLAVGGTLTSANFIKQDGSFPTADDGTILQKDGLVYIRRDGSWEQLISAGDAGGDQPGDIKQSMRSPEQMPGWLPFDGRTIFESAYAQLFDVVGLAAFITGTAPNRVMVLPNATDRVLINSNTPGQTGGSDTVQLTTTNMPAHTHGVAILGASGHTHTGSLSNAGGHIHSTVTTGANGRHTHPVIDPGHRHNGADNPAGGGIVNASWGGQNKLDGPINDASHTWSVEVTDWTRSAVTGISVGADGSEHQHQTDNQGAHGHAVTIDTAGAHTHAVSETSIGNGAPFSVKPKYLTVYTYIKA